jgi:mannose/fructose/N-acetylgalactosamine-specific phosphotransferase system component IIC
LSVSPFSGYLLGPARIDLSNLKFVTTDEPAFIHSDDGEEVEEEDDIVFDETDSPTRTPADNGVPDAPTADNGVTDAPTDDEGTTAAPSDTDAPSVAPADGAATDAPADGAATDPPADGAATDAPADGGNRNRRLAEGSFIDIVIFKLPDYCATSMSGCDWSDLGVGGKDYDVEGGISYCCSDDVISRGICDSSANGRLIVDKKKFRGERREISIPATGEYATELEDALFNESVDGEYILILANCDDNGREVMTLGSMEWVSQHGYLPGDMIGLAKFYAALAGIYALINLWYGCGMKRYQDSAIPIQKYIIASMVLGLLELIFRTMDLFIWNERGTRAYPVVYIGESSEEYEAPTINTTDILMDFSFLPVALIFGVMKRSLARCLGVMVSMGWGVVRDSLGATMFKIVFLGLLYCGLTTARDALAILAVTDVQSISTGAEDELIDLVLVLTPMIIVINVIFYFWIVNSLTATTQYLQNMNQTSKLRRHLRLRCIIMTSLFIAFSWLILNVAEVLTDFLGQEQQWIMEAAMHANYVFVLVGVAILWRPNSNAKDYALQMELPVMNEDGEGEYELELSCVVPSAEDGNDPDHPNGVRAEEGQFS